MRKDFLQVSCIVRHKIALSLETLNVTMYYHDQEIQLSGVYIYILYIDNLRFDVKHVECEKLLHVVKLCVTDQFYMFLIIFHNIFQAGFSALHLAAQNGHNESSRVLLYAGCNTDHKNNVSIW